MDRLVCGDVGFGKTEVAHPRRVQGGAGRQAGGGAGAHHAAGPAAPPDLRRPLRRLPRARRGAVALPHARGRRRPWSRAWPAGEVDVVIGTHRLLSEDIKFKDLGLLVVDEEQRFGVTHKERIKQLRTDVDVLTLTATPIPRTLEMSLTGIRDLTLLHTPPAERQPILTYVGEDDDRAVAEAIRRELLREGQVFFVHNRVQDIEQVADRVRDLVPEARVAVAHGQMDEGTPRAGGARLRRRRATTCSSARRSSSPASTCRR